MSWKTAPLGELADVKLGKMLDQKKNQGEYRRYLGNDNVQWNEFKLDEIKEMRIKESERERYGLKRGDLLICEGGDPGRCALWMSNEEMYYQKALNRVRVCDEIDPRFILYYFLHIGATHEVAQYYTGGATIKHLPNAALKRVEIRYPELDKQRRIASILMAYDNLIENNRKQIALLEEATQRLYKEWFIDFKYPDHELDSIDPKTDLPLGWKIGSLGEIVEFKRGKTITAKQAKEGCIPVVAGGIKPAYFHSRANTVAPLITVSGSGANAGFTRLYTTDVWASDCSYVDSTMTDVLAFVYGSVCCIGRGFKHLQRGSAQPHVYPAHINEMIMAIPTAELQREFCDFLDPMIHQLDLLSSQIERACEARDRLLPKLMSGEIEVS